MIPRAALYALVLLLGSALWSMVPALLFLTLGWKVDEAKWMGNPGFTGPWIEASLLIFLAGYWALLLRDRGPAKNGEPLLAAGFSLLFLYLGYTLLNFQDYLFLLKGHAVSFDGDGWIFLATGVLLLANLLAQLLKDRARGEWALAATLVFLSALAFFSVHSFSLAGGYSNMLPMIEVWGRTLLHGHSPYGLKAIPGQQTDCCYLPGLWLAFLPAAAFNIDSRFIEAIYTLFFAGVVWLALRPRDRPLGSWFLVLFLLNPWSLLRQEDYFSPYLLSWACFFLALRRGRANLAAGCFGWGLSAHLFSWALLPVWVAWTAKRRGWGGAARELLWAVGAAALVILPFVIWDPLGFFKTALLVWVEMTPAIGVSHFGLAAWMASWHKLLAVLAFVFMGTGTWAAWRGSGSLDSLFRWLAFSLGLVFLASYHIEHYYYFVPLALLLFHEIALLGRDGTVESGHENLPSNGEKPDAPGREITGTAKSGF